MARNSLSMGTGNNSVRIHRWTNDSALIHESTFYKSTAPTVWHQAKHIIGLGFAKVHLHNSTNTQSPRASPSEGPQMTCPTLINIQKAAHQPQNFFEKHAQPSMQYLFDCILHVSQPIKPQLRQSSSKAVKVRGKSNYPIRTARDNDPMRRKCSRVLHIAIPFMTEALYFWLFNMRHCSMETYRYFTRYWFWRSQHC